MNAYKMAFAWICVLALLGCESYRGEGVWKNNVVLYRALNAESELPCFGDGALNDCGQTLYRGEEADRNGFETGFLSAASYWYDCSGIEFECVANDEYLLAVPKRKLAKGLIYRTHGSELIVEECFKPEIYIGSDDACEVALISSRCVEDCACLDRYSRDRGVLFYYTPKVGITAFFVLADRHDLQSALPAFSWTLVADQGFLKKKLSLPPAGENQPCRARRG